MSINSFGAEKTASPFRLRPSSPGKVKGPGGESHDMTLEEMKARYKHNEEGVYHTKLENHLT